MPSKIQSRGNNQYRLTVSAGCDGNGKQLLHRKTVTAANITEASRRFGVPAAWIVAVMAAESAGDVRAVSSAGTNGVGEKCRVSGTSFMGSSGRRNRTSAAATSLQSFSPLTRVETLSRETRRPLPWLSLRIVS